MMSRIHYIKMQYMTKDPRRFCYLLYQLYPTSRLVSKTHNSTELAKINSYKWE